MNDQPVENDVCFVYDLTSVYQISGNLNDGTFQIQKVDWPNGSQKSWKISRFFKRITRFLYTGQR